MRISEVLGKPIVSADTGERVGRVEDLLLDLPRHALVGVLVTDGVLSQQRVLPFEEVLTIGVDAIIVKTIATMRDARDWVRDGRAATRSRSVHGKDVVTADGARIGTVGDLIADERTGQVEALEIATARHGVRRSRSVLVHAMDEIQLTNDVVVVPQSIAGTRPSD